MDERKAFSVKNNTIGRCTISVNVRVAVGLAVYCWITFSCARAGDSAKSGVRSLEAEQDELKVPGTKRHC